MAQAKYWRGLVDLKVYSIYIGYYQEQCEGIDKWSNIFVALCTSGAVSGWMIWEKAQLLWAFIMAIFNILNAIKVFLPYKKRMAGLASLSNELNKLIISVESDWYGIKEGNISDSETHDRWIKIKSQINTAVTKAFPNSSLPKDEYLFAISEKEAAIYLTNYYSINATAPPPVDTHEGWFGIKKFFYLFGRVFA